MKVKIGDRWYDPHKEPILIELTDTDKFNISHMDRDATKYICYPEGYDYSAIIKFAEVKDGARLDDDLWNSPNNNIRLKCEL